jgi:hypothetical protein
MDRDKEKSDAKANKKRCIGPICKTEPLRKNKSIPQVSAAFRSETIELQANCIDTKARPATTLLADPWAAKTYSPLRLNNTVMFDLTKGDPKSAPVYIVNLK